MKTGSKVLVLAFVVFAIALISLPVPLGAAVYGAIAAIVCVPLLIVLVLWVIARDALLRLIYGDEG